jgi:hypothetical protein
MFGNRKQIRQLAARVLVVWVLGVLATFANACVNVEHAAAAPEVHAVQVHHPGHTPAAAGQACRGFCELSSLSLPTPKPVLDKASMSPHVIPAIDVLAVRPPSIASCPSSDRPHANPPPIPIAFLRLAL